MKKLSFLIALLVVGVSAHAASKSTKTSYPSVYGEPFIFVERGVEFAVFPDGQFDFFYNPRGFSLNVNIPNVNISYNAGYNYNPFVQYDDYGAVIQIENVPIYYDYYGRIIQAGSVRIAYNHLGRIARIGGLHIHYNPHNQYTHYSGFINSYNKAYFYRPWHRYYEPPHIHHVVVYSQPYRAHYYPQRMKYNSYRKYYQKHYSNGFKKRYYNPGDRAVVYHRGRRSDNRRDLRNSSTASYTGYSTRGSSNIRSSREPEVRRVSTQSRSQNPSAVRSGRTVERTFKNTASRTNILNRGQKDSRSSVRNTTREMDRSSPRVRSRENRSDSPTIQGPSVQRSNRSSSPVTPRATVRTNTRSSSSAQRASNTNVSRSTNVKSAARTSSSRNTTTPRSTRGRD